MGSPLARVVLGEGVASPRTRGIFELDGVAVEPPPRLVGVFFFDVADANDELRRVGRELFLSCPFPAGRGNDDVDFVFSRCLGVLPAEGGKDDVDCVFSRPFGVLPAAGDLNPEPPVMLGLRGKDDVDCVLARPVSRLGCLAALGAVPVLRRRFFAAAFGAFVFLRSALARKVDATGTPVLTLARGILDGFSGDGILEVVVGLAGDAGLVPVPNCPDLAVGLGILLSVSFT